MVSYKLQATSYRQEKKKKEKATGYRFRKEIKQRFLKLLLMISLPMIFLSPVYAQDISFTASVDKNKIALNDRITLSISVSGVKQISKPILPPLPDFTVHSFSRSQNISVINGNVSSAITFNYGLVPKRLGKHTVGAAKINYKGKIYTTQPISVEIIPSLSHSGSKKQGAQLGIPSSSVSEKGEKVFIEQVVDKKRAYVNEQVTLSFRIYQRVNFLQDPKYSPIALTGFWQEGLPQKKYYKTVEGVKYLVTEINTALFPIASGKYVIEPASFICVIEDFSQRHSRSIWDWQPFEDLFSRGKTLSLRSQSLEIEAIPLPESSPANFQGAVGDFSISASVDKNKVKIEEPITFTMNIKGTGNFKAITAPSFPPFPNFKQYISEGNSKIFGEDKKIQGEKNCQHILIPQKEGKFIIPAIEFSYFAPQQKSYQTIKTEPISVEILANPFVQDKNFSFSPNSIKKEFPVHSQKNYLLILANQIAKGIFLLGKLLCQYRIFLLFFLLGFLILLFGRKKYRQQKQRLSTDIKYVRQRRSYSLVKKRLGQVSKYLKRKTISEKDEKEFHALLFKALSEYIADRLNISASGITINQIESSLRKKGISEEVIQKAINCLHHCELHRFAPHQERSSTVRLNQMRELAKRVEEIIVYLQKCPMR